MPEGPSIVILREEAAALAGQVIRHASGNAKIDLRQLRGRRVLALRSFGNIMKNEVLFRIRVHPLSTLGALSTYKLRQLVAQAHVYAFEFLAWKQAHVLARHWLVHNRGRCPRHGIALQRAYLGKTHRRSFFCLRCQKLYTET